MCGILGSVPAFDDAPFRAALTRLAHRGPDGEGVWHGPENDVTLGHRRLAIVDLSEYAAQPMHFADRYTITYNGEIYNFPELRRDLRQKGRQMRTVSDTEVLLASWAEWGPDCLSRFNGMWAFGLWDAEEKCLYLARDRFGKKPLFYTEQNGKFIFASEMKALLPFLPQVRPAANFEWMRDNFLLYEATEHCLVEGIRRFPAGHWGRWKDGKLQLTRWWNTAEQVTRASGPYKGQVANFREIFTDACRIRMRADVRIGTALSGGLDSSAVLATMAAVGQELPGSFAAEDWQHAAVAAFPGSPFDETKFAQEVARAAGIEPEIVPLDPLAQIGQLEKTLWFFEELHDTSPLPMAAVYGALRKAGVRVTLDGHGADELLAGYGEGLFHAFADAGAATGEIRGIFDAYNGLVPATDTGRRKPKAGWLTWLRYALAADRPKRVPRIRGHFNAYLYELFHTSILPTLLRNYDRYSMMHGVEIRMPFMDHRLVSFCFGLPWDHKLRNGFTKAILRAAMKGRLPDSIRLRKAKVPFTTPTVEWLQGPWREYFSDLIASQDFKECSLIDAGKVGKLVRKVMENPKASYYDGLETWKALAPYLWERSFLRG